MHPRRIFAALGVLGLAVLAWASLAPVSASPRERLFEIPPGTSERRLAGEDLAILPQTIRLEAGDVLALRNADEAPHVFGPTLIMPGQTFRLPFGQASVYSFECTAHASGKLEIVVAAPPEAGWERLRWRWRHLTDKA